MAGTSARWQPSRIVGCQTKAKTWKPIKFFQDGGAHVKNNSLKKYDKTTDSSDYTSARKPKATAAHIQLRIKPTRLNLCATKSGKRSHSQHLTFYFQIF